MESKTVLLFLLSAGCLALLAVSVGGNSWLDVHWLDVHLATVGLWKNCNKFTGSCITFEWDWVSSKLHTVRAFAVIAALMAAVATLGSFIRIMRDSDGKAVSAFFLGAGCCMLIAMAVYTSEYKVKIDYGAEWGWSFILGWIATIGLFVVSGLTSCLK